MASFRLLALTILVVLTSGCVTRSVQTLEELPLPQQNHCCWQALQQLVIYYGSDTYKLQAALAATHEGTVLVLLDPLGRRLLSVKQQGTQREIFRAPELPTSIPEQFLLASSLLAWLPVTDWQLFFESSSVQHWQFNVSQDNRLLSYRGHPIIRLGYPTQSPSLEKGIGLWTATTHETIVLQHLYRPLTISITTERWDAL